MIALTRQALKRPSVTIILALGIIIFGVITIGSVKQELFPSLSFPIVTITTVYPGASAETVDTAITTPIENAISGLQGIESTQSTSSEGFALTIIQFDVNADIKTAKTDVADKLSTLTLPTGVQAPKVGTFDFTALPALNASVSGKNSSTSLADLQTRVQSEVVPALTSIKGVSKVNLTGGEQAQVLITLDPDKLAQNKLTQQQVIQLLQANNLAFPVGTLDEAGRALPLRVTHQYTSTAEIENLILGLKGGIPAGLTAGAGTGATTPPAGAGGAAATTPAAQVQVPDALLLRLKDIGTVKVAKTGNATITRTNGNPSLGLQVYLDPNANIVGVTKEIRGELDKAANAQSSTPVSFKIVTEQAATIQKSISGVVQEGLIGAVIAVIVIFVFLLSLRTTLIAAVSIPVSVVVALILMQLQGFSLNVITLGGLAVAIGRVVDDSIVVLENIYRHVREGDEVNASVIEGTREVAGAITTSTLTTVAVFLPLGLAGGLISKLFLPFSLTVTYALLASLLVALTVVPLLARLFMGRVAVKGKAAKAAKTEDQEENWWLQRIYTPILTWSLRHRAITLVIAAVVFFGSMALTSQLKFAFIPDSPQKNISIKLATAPGTDLTTTTNKTIQVENIAKGLQSQGKVADILTTIGQGTGNAAAIAQFTGGRAAGVTNESALTLSLTDQAGDPQALATSIESQINALGGFQTVTVQTVNASQQGGAASSGLDIQIVSSDINNLRAANKQILDFLSGDKARELRIANVTTSLADVKPALQIDVDPQKALLHGSTTAQIAQQVAGLLNGTTAGTVTLANGPQINGINTPLSLFVQVDPATLSQDKLKATLVGTVNPVALSDVAAIKEVPGAVSISRINGDQAASITGKITSIDTVNVQANVEKEVKKLQLPAGVTVGSGSQAQSQTEALRGLGVALLIAIGLVYLVMLIWSGSLLNPLVILFSLPLAAIGAILGLFLTSKPIGITSLIGMLMLIGIVVTNAVVLLDLVEQNRRKGLNVYDSIVNAGRVRLRPILMTAIATIVALFPLALSSGNESFLTSDLAIVVMGGLFTSTLLTLLVVPVVYSLVSSLRNRLTRKPPAPPAPVEEVPLPRQEAVTQG